MQLNDVAALLGPEPLPLETGYERLPDGVAEHRDKIRPVVPW